jgi:hypothetical protein
LNYEYCCQNLAYIVKKTNLIKKLSQYQTVFSGIIPLTSSTAAAAAVEAAGAAVAAAASGGSQSMPVTPQSTEMPTLPVVPSGKELMNGSSKLECLSAANLSSVVQCNTLAYWGHSEVTKKIKFCEYSLRPPMFQNNSIRYLRMFVIS